MNGSIKITSLIFGVMVFLFSVGAMYDHQYASAKAAASDYEAVTVAQLSKDLECLALNIYREGGYEPIEGRIAIAQVTMNRVVSSNFPNDVCGVVYQKNRVVTKTVCQFSWYCDASHRNRRSAAPRGSGLAVLGLALRSRKLGIGAAVAFTLFLAYVALLGLVISRM